MGFWAAVGTIAGYAAKAAPYVEAAVGIYAGIQQTKIARETMELAETTQQQQEAELLRQRRIAEVSARRTVRAAKARQLAQQAAAGAILSTTAAGIIGLETTLEAGLVDLAARTQFNIESGAARARQATASATGSMIGGMITAAAGTVEFTDLLRQNIRPKKV